MLLQTAAPQSQPDFERRAPRWVPRLAARGAGGGGAGTVGPNWESRPARIAAVAVDVVDLGSSVRTVRRRGDIRVATDRPDRPKPRVDCCAQQWLCDFGDF